MLLFDFETIDPRYFTAQEKGLEWFVKAHVQAEKTRGLSESEHQAFTETVQEQILKYGCKPDRIGTRAHVLADFLHTDWDAMEIYRLHESPEGKGLGARIEVYKKEVETIFEQYYPEGSAPPDDLIHVTCTGYISPSGAQKIVSKRNWGAKTTVTHAYHMGCYGSMPAIRMGLGFLQQLEDKERVDIVHTEISSIHSNPGKHSPDQLVAQSLFADGFVKYSMGRSSKKPHFRLLGVREEIIPDSTEAMTWDLSDWNFAITLAKEIPVLIRRALRGFLERLMQGRSWEKAYFAIHPGGPKIVFQIQELLGLSDVQIERSLQMLQARGNMSSATLPHIWKEMLLDPKIEEGAFVVSLAFGPGLTIVGAFMEKRCGC